MREGSKETAWNGSETPSNFAANQKDSRNLNEIMSKTLCTAGGTADKFYTWLKLLVDNKFPPAKIIEAPYDSGHHLWIQNRLKEAEQAYLAGAMAQPSSTDYALPGPAVALADLYEEEHNYAKELPRRKFAARRSGETYTKGHEPVFVYTEYDLKSCTIARKI